MDKDTRKKLISSYKERPVTGGVFAIVNDATGRMLLLAERDIAGSKNKFQFAQSTNLCAYGKLGEDWRKYGPGAFRFQLQEELEKKPEQTSEEFMEDLQVLAELWREKLADHDFY